MYNIFCFNIPLKSVDKLKIGRAHSFMRRPARSRLSLVSFGCLYKYITALPIPEYFKVDCSIGGYYIWNKFRLIKYKYDINYYFRFTSANSLSNDSRTCNEGKLLSGIGANQSVKTFNTLCSIKANIKLCFFNCDKHLGNIVILLTAGFPSLFNRRSLCNDLKQNQNIEFR